MREFSGAEIETVREWIFVRVIRFDTGRVTVLRIPGTNLQELLNCANDTFGDRTKMIGGPKPFVPKLVKKEKRSGL